MVCFVYRDEVYNKETEDKGIAELIVAKHRAGSVGTVRLKWQAEFTAFDDLADDFRPATGYSASAESFQGPGSSMSDGFRPRAHGRKPRRRARSSGLLADRPSRAARESGISSWRRFRESFSWPTSWRPSRPG